MQKIKRVMIVGFFVAVILAILGCHRYPYYYQDIDLGTVGPGIDHWFGTDLLGRDLFSRTVYACLISLSIGFFATFFAVFIGGVYGIVSGYFGGWIDIIMMRLIDIAYPIPLTLIVILLMVMLGQSVVVLFFAISLIEWMTTARIIRAEVLRLRESGYVTVAFGFGERKRSIIFRHIVPNLKHLLIVCFVVTLPGVILIESFLSFIGLGIQPPRSSLGLLIEEGSKRMGTSPWEIIFPAMTLVAVIFSLMYVGGMQKRKHGKTIKNAPDRI